MLVFVDETLKILATYFVYLYPGFIFLWVYRFLKGLNFKETKESIIKCIVISYVLKTYWLKWLDLFLDLTVNKIFPKWIFPTSADMHPVLMLSSIVLPFVIWKLRDAKWVTSVLKIFGIGTNFRDNPLDIANHYQSGPWIRAIMDDYGVLYEGYLRNFNNDLETGEFIMISNYMISKLNKDTNTYVQTYPVPEDEGKDKKKKKKDHEKPVEVVQITEQEIPNEEEKVTGSKEWVVLSRSKITRLEIDFNDPH